MVPFCLESIRCLEADIVSNAIDLDMALIYGVGFPPLKVARSALLKIWA